MNVPDTTLICVDCQHPRLAARAIRLSLEQCSYSSAKLLTDHPPVGADLPKHVEVITIDPIRTTLDYSRFIVKTLVHHISTSFVQIVQWDGYVLNGKAWSDAFFQYDYIGARWFFREEGRNVGNGGFSLRSRRLLAALQDPRIVVTEAEDTAICITYRDILEREHGIRFAPPSVADQYAFEGFPPKLTEFGFHRVFNFAYLYDEAKLCEVLALLPDADFCSESMVTLIDYLVQMNRIREAQCYIERMRKTPKRLSALIPQYREKFEYLAARFAS